MHTSCKLSEEGPGFLYKLQQSVLMFWRVLSYFAFFMGKEKKIGIHLRVASFFNKNCLTLLYIFYIFFIYSEKGEVSKQLLERFSLNVSQ